MAFEQGSFSSAADLLGKINTFLAGNGWTLTGSSYQRGNSFYHEGATESDTTGNKIYITTGVNISGGSPASPFTDSEPSLRELTTGTYWAFDDTDMTYFVVRYSAGKYQHLAMGEITKYESTHTEGALTISSRARTGTDGETTYLATRLHNVAFNPAKSTGGMYLNTTYYDQNQGVEFTNKLEITNKKVCFCLGLRLLTFTTLYMEQNPYYEKVISSNRSDNGLPVFSTVWCNAHATTDQVDIVGELSSIFHTDTTGYEPGTVVNFGSDEWVLFPNYDQTIETYGFAYKK